MKIAKRDLKDAIRLVFPGDNLQAKAEFIGITTEELENILEGKEKVSQEIADTMLRMYREYATNDRNTPMSDIFYAGAISKPTDTRTYRCETAKNNIISKEEIFKLFDHIFTDKISGYLITEISLGLAIVVAIITLIYYFLIK